MSDLSELKRQAAEFAVGQFIHSDMLVGLGAGSTALFALRKLAALIEDGTLTGIRAIPCAREVAEEATRLGIHLVEFEKHTRIDVTIDGADEVDPELNLIKGGGGALLREKIVAQASQREVIVVDHTKPSPALGTHWAVPVEVSPFGWQSQAGFLEGIGGEPVLRTAKDGKTYLTDQGNYILDTNFGIMEDPASTAKTLQGRAGIVEHGLFIDLATDLIVAAPEGITHKQK